MVVESKVFRLGDIAKNLCNKVMDLEVQVAPSTPPEVLEERRKVVTEDATRIEEVEALCAKEVNQVSHTWEYLIDSDELEKITEQVCTAKI